MITPSFFVCITYLLITGKCIIENTLNKYREHKLDFKMELPMKIDIASDLHLECGLCNWDNLENSRVLILSGDIIPVTELSFKVVEWFENICSKYNTVLYVLGNHEYYGSSLEQTPGQIFHKLWHIENLHILNDSIFKIDDVVFVGGTGWTKLDNPINAVQIQTSLSDFKYITCDEHPIFPSDINLQFVKWLEFVNYYLIKEKDSKVVIITHHAPSRQSIHPRYENDRVLNEAYCNNLDYQFSDFQNLKLWVHGHTHDEFEYQMTPSCKVVCHPRGYYGIERFNHYQPKTVTV